MYYILNIPEMFPSVCLLLIHRLRRWPNLNPTLDQLLGHVHKELCVPYCQHNIIVGFTLTVVTDFRRFLSQFSTNCHEIV